MPSNGKKNNDRNVTEWKRKHRSAINVAKGLAGMTFEALAPGIKETATSAQDALRESKEFVSKAKNQVSGQAGSIEGNTLGRKAMGIIKDAFNDLKNGSYGIDNMSDDSYDMEADFDSDIRDYDSGISSSTDPETTSMFEAKKNTAMLGKVIAHGNATTISSFANMTKTISNTTLKAAQAQTAQLTNVMLTSMSAQNAQMSMANGKLEAINSNLVNIIEFNNNTQAEYYQKSAEFQSSVLEMMNSFGESLAKMQDIVERKEEYDEFDFSRGFNFGSYKDMVKKNISNSTFGMLGSSLSMVSGLGGNPITMALPMALEFLTPGLIKNPIKRFDKNITKGIENLIYRLGDLEYSNSIFAPLGEFLGKKRKSIANMNMGNYKKDAMSWNGVAQRYLTEVIPSYLSKIEAGINGTPERYYHEGKGRFQTIKDLDKDFNKRMTGAYEFGMRDFSTELQNQMKKNGISEQEVELIMNRMNAQLLETVQSTSKNQGSNRIKSQQLLNSSLKGKLDNATIQELIHTMNDNVTETINNMSDFLKNMDNGYRHLYNKTGQKKDPTVRVRGNIKNTKAYSLTGELLSDMNKEDRELAEKKLENKEEGFIGNILKFLKGESSKNGNLPSDKFSRWLYNIMSGVKTNDDDIDISYLDEIMERQALEERKFKKKNQTQNKPKQKKGSGKKGKKNKASNIHSARSSISNEDDDSDDDDFYEFYREDIRTMVSSIVSSNIKSSGGIGWSQDDHDALTKVIPDKLDKIEKAISKLGENFTPPTGGGNATGQSSNTKPTGGSNKNGLTSFKEALTSTADKIEQKAKQAQAKLNNASKGNESGPGSNNLSSADIIANRLQENENSLANMVQATNDNFMAPMVGGIFGKDGMIRKFFSKDNLKAIGDKLFNEDSGIFKNFGSWFKDQMDYVKYVFTGKGYTDRKGNKYEEKKDSVFDHLANGYDWVYTKTMQHIFGDDYKENENYNKYFKRFDFKSRREKKRNKRLGLESEDTENISKESEDAIAHGNATQASGKVDTSSNIDPSNKSNGTINDQINDLIKLRDSGKTGEAAKKRINKELNELYHKRSAENKKNKKSQESSNESVSDNIVKETQKAVKEVADNIRNAGKKVVDKTIGDISDKDIANDQKKFTEGWKDSFKKFLPVGIAGALVGGGIGALTSLQGGGAVAPLFFSGGPIAGAVLGISATLLARSEKFKKVLFGEEGEDGEKRGGLISQKTQNFFKKHAPLLVGGAAIGALKGVFKTAVGGGVVGGPGGFLLNSLLPGGIIGGAVLGLGVALLKSSDTFKNILFGNKDDDGSDTKKESKSISKKLSEAFAKSGHFVKGGLKGAAIGVGSGIALGSMGIMGGALSVGGPVGMGILGLGLGIASQADRVKTMLFGEEEFDGNGNTKGRKKNGLFPRMRNYLVMNVFEPLKDQLQEKVEDFGFWLKKHITYPFRLAFGPIIDSFREIRKNISDTIKNVFENVALSISKTVKTAVSIAFKPVTNAFKKVGKNITNVAFNGMKMALAPLSLGLNLVKFGSRKLRKKALGQRTKTLRQHAGIIFRDVKDKTLQQWENDDREYAPGILGGIDKFLTHGRDIFRNTREGIDAAKASYNTGMKQQGFNSLGWMNIDAEKKKDKETRQMLKNDRKYWKNIDAVRRDIATENKHSEIFASGDALKSYKKRLKKAGFKHIDLIQNSNDLNDLLYNKADFLERIKKGDRNVIKDSNATMNFYESTKDYQKRIMDKFDVITKEFMKFATQNAVARRKNLDIKDVSDIDKNLMQAGLTWEDIGIDRGDLTDIITLSDRDWKTYMNERLKPENRGRALYDDVIRDILEKQAADAEKKGETNQEVIERLDALNEISEANARMNASEQMGDTGASESEIEKAAGHDFGNGFDDPITRYKKEKEKAEARAREGLESEKIRKGHKSSQDEDEEDKDKGKDDDKTSEKDKRSVFGGIWDGVSGLLGGVGNLFGSKSFWKYAGIAAIAGATFGPWAKDVFSKILKVLEPVTTFLGEKVKAGATWLSAHLPDIASHLVSNLVDNMGLIVSSVWKLAGSVVSTVAKKMVNGIFHVVGMNGPFEDVETSVNETKTFETEKEAQDYGNLTGKNVDGKTVHGTSEYVDDEGKFHRTAKGNVLGAAGKNSLLYATSNLHRKSKWLATWPAKLGVATTKFASRKLTKPIFAVGKGAKWVAKNTLGKSEKVSKILTKVLNGLKKIKDKAVKILKLKSGSVWDTVCEKAIKMIEKVFVNNPQMQAKLTEKIISVNTKGFSKLFLPIAIGMGVYDAFTGASKKTTAYLFGIDEDAVDGKMQTISALLKVLSGLPVFGWIDLIAEIYYQFSGNDLRQEFARWLYNLLPGGDKDALQDEIDRYELEYEKYKNENNLNLDMGAYREVRRKNKQKIDFSKWDASDEELAEYQQNKYNTVNYTSKSNSEMNSNNTPFYSGTGSYDVAADDPSNVGFGIGDSRRKQRHVVGYGNSMQADPRWANYPLGKFPSGRTSTMATGGCGPTALSMVASSTSPIAVAQDAKNSGYIKDGGATTDLFTKGAKKYGLNASNVSRSSLENTLKSGKPTILSGKSSGNGPYTEAGHVIVAKGMDSAGNTIVNDPMRGTRKIKASELSKGMTHGWSYSNNVGYGPADNIVTRKIVTTKNSTSIAKTKFKQEEPETKKLKSSRSLLLKMLEKAKSLLLGLSNLVKDNISGSIWQVAIQTTIRELSKLVAKMDYAQWKKVSNSIQKTTYNTIGAVTGNKKPGSLADKAGHWINHATRYTKLGRLASAATHIGLSGYNALNGALSASLLFGIAPEDVTVGMRVISTAINTLVGGTLMELLLVVIESLTGIDGRQWLARKIYEFFDEDNVLEEAIKKMENQRVEYNKAYGRHLSASEYNELINSGSTIGGRLKKFGNKLIDAFKGNDDKDTVDAISYGFGDVAGYGGINMMSMGNAMHQSIYNEQPSSKGNYFIYKGKKYKQAIDAKGESTWQQMGFLDLFNHYTKIDAPKGFDPDTALSKGGKAENLINVNGTTYDVNKLNAILKNDLATGGNASISGLSSREMSDIRIALKEVEAYKNRKTTTATSKSQSSSKKVNVNIVRPTIMQEYGKSLNQGIKNMFPDSDHSITEKMLANKYGFATSDNPQMANGAGPNALLEAVNQGTLKTEEAIRRKINVGYQATDGEYNFNRAEFYQGLKVADIKAMAEYMPSLLTDPKIPKFKAIYNYYVKSGQYPLKRDLRENEIADIFGRSDFVKALGGSGIEGDYEYKYGFPFYQTLDTRWADIPWRGLNVKNRGGDLASLAMVATAFSPYILDPGYIYDRWIGKNSSWYDSTKGLKFDKVFSDDGYPAQKAAKVNKQQVKVKKLMSYNTILQYLKANKPVVMTGYRYKGSPFGGYYDKANAPLSGPDDYATVVARAANDAHVAILNPYSTRTQNGIFDVHKLNDLVGKGGIKAVKEAYGITGPSGGGITKVDLSEKSTSTSDYKDLSKEKGLGKIIALFENFAAIGNHLFDALLGTEDYVSIFDEIEGEGGIDEEDNGKGGKDTSSKTTTTTTTTTTTNSSGDTTSVSGINNGSLNTNGKVNCYLYRNAYYLQLGTNYYKRITDEEYTRLNSEGSIILNSSVPHNLMTGTARIYGVANSGQVTTSTGQNVLRNTPTSKNYIESGTIGMPTVTPSSTISTVGGNDLNSAMSTLDKMSTTSKKKTGLISAIKNWIKKLPSTNPNASKVSNVDFNRFSVGGASRDLVFGPGDSERDKQKAAWANKKKTYTKTASQKALSNQIKTILNKKARTGKLTPSEEKILAEYNARIQSNAPKQPYSYSVLLNDTTATTPTTSAASTTTTSDSGVYSQIQIPEIQKFNTTYFGGMNESPNRSIEYLAMHYTAGTSSATGAANGIANYFNSPEAGGTADFIVDDGSIVQFNPDPKKYFCHAVGDGAITGQGTTSLAASLHGTAGNPNSISIEMCSSIKPGGNSNDAMDPNWYITEETENNAAGLAAKLLKDYNIPQDHLIMHHHVSGKICPAPWVQDESKLANWEAFKQKVATGVSGTTNSVGTSDSLSGTTTTTTETTTAEAERDFDKLSSGAYMTAIANATIAASMGDDYEQAKQHYLEAAYDQQFGGPETTTTTTTTTTPGTTDASNSISATSGSGTVSTLDPNNVPQSVWNYFTSKGYSTYGTAGIMGNMNHESGMIVNRKQGDFSNGYTASADYTKAADAGSIDFVNDSIGYGLVQFTYHTLKQSLLNRAKSEGKSVGDLGVQLDEIDNYLNGNGLAGKLKAATSVRQASNIFLHEYERPADQSAAVEATRASAGESFFAQFAKSTGYGPGPDGKNILQILSKKNPLNYRAKRSRAVGYGGNWLEICAEVKRQMNAQCAAKGQWYSWYDYVPISVNGVDINIRQDCSGYVGGCLTVYGCANMLNTATPAYYRGNQDLINAGFKDMDWPGQENLLPGDIIVDTNPGAGGHVEVYAGNGQVYSAGSDAAIQNPGTTGISRSSYPIVWRPSDAGAVGSIAQSSNATNSTNSTTTTTETTENKPEYMDPFTRMISGFNNIALTTTKGRAIAFGDGDNPETFFTNTLGGNISSTYGRRSGELGNEFHRGMDIEAPSGRKIYSPVNGKIVSKGSDVAGYGNYAVVRDRRGKNHIFAHMKNPSVYGIGDDISRYDVLGEVGSTGRSTGSHLHYEIRNNGNKYSTVDPSNYSYKDDISKSLNIHNTNQSIGSSQTETASVGSGNRDIDTNSVKEKLNVAINTKSIEGKMDTMIEALQMMVENTSHTINTATPSITQNNTTVYGNGDKKTTTTKKQIEKKDETRTREGDILVGMHKVIAKRG